MKTLVLDTISKSITIELSASAATINPDFTSHWADDSTNSFVEGSTGGILNHTTPVIVVDSPTASVRRVIKEITLNNCDTAPITAIVKYVDSSTGRVLYKVALQVNETWTLDATYQVDGSIKSGIPIGIHNGLSGKQGGSVPLDQFYHLTQAQHDIVDSLSSLSGVTAVHNSLIGLQGGSVALDQFYHLPLSSYTIALQSASSDKNGYLTSGDWNYFYSITSTISSQINSITSLSGTVTGQSEDINTLSGSITSLSGTVTSLSASLTSITGSHAAVTLSNSANGLSLSDQELSLALASSSTTGSLTNTDWSTFNGKQDSFDLVGLSSTVTANTQNISSLSSTVTGFTTQIDSLSSTVTGYGSQIDSLSATVTGYGSQIDSLSSTVTGHTVEIAALSSSVTTNTQDIQTLSAAITSSTGTHSPVTIGNANGLTLNIQELSMMLASSTSTATGTITNAEFNTFNSITSVSADLYTLSGTVTGLNEVTIPAIEDYLDTIDENISSLSSTVTGYGSQIDSLSSTVTGYGSQITSLSASITSLSGDVTNLSGTVTGFTTQIDSLSSTVTGHTNDIATLSSSITSLSGTVTSLSASLTGISSGTGTVGSIAKFATTSTLTSSIMTENVDEILVSGDISAKTIYENEPMVFKGTAIKLISPYTTKTNTYRGQLHCHTTNSDGVSSSTAVVTFYKNLGYDFIAITDHDFVTPDPGVTGILFIQGIEQEVENLHTNRINSIVASSSTSTTTVQALINEANVSGDFMWINHPLWENDHWLTPKLLSVDGYYGIEVWNALVTKKDSSSKINQVLNSHRKTYLLSCDDLHNPALSWAGSACVYVFADTCTVPEILSNLKAGNFYASNGATIDSIIISDKTITINTPTSGTIEFIGNSGSSSSTIVLQTSASTVTSSYTISGNELYVRGRVIRNSDSLTAWTNPMYIFDDSKVSSNRFYRDKLFINNPALDHICLADRFSFIGSQDLNLANNAYYDNGFKYIKNDKASKLTLSSNNNLIYAIAASGTSANNISFTNVLTVSGDGTVTAVRFYVSSATPLAANELASKSYVDSITGGSGVTGMAGSGIVGTIPVFSTSSSLSSSIIYQNGTKIGIDGNLTADSICCVSATILANAYRFYTGSRDGSSAFGDFRTNPDTGNTIISAKMAAIFFNYDHGASGTFWADGVQKCYAYMSKTGQLTLNKQIVSDIPPALRNTLDAAGGVAIGSAYANTVTAPENGLITQGIITIRGYTGGTLSSSVSSFTKNLVIGGTYNQSYNSGSAVLIHLADYSNDAGDAVYPIYVENENNDIDFYILGGNGGPGSSYTYFGNGKLGIGTKTGSEKFNVSGGNAFILGTITGIRSYALSSTPTASNELVTKSYVDFQTSSGAVTAQITSLSSSVTSLSGTVTGYTSQIDSLSSTVTGYGAQIESLSSTVTGYTDQINSLSSSVTSLSGTVTGFTSQIDSLSSTVTGHTVQILTLSGSLTSLSDTVTGHTVQINTLSSSITSLQTATGSLTSQIDSLSSTVTGQTSEISALSSTVTGHTVQISALSSSVTSLQSATGSLTTQINSLEAATGTLTAQINSLSSTVTGQTVDILNLSGTVTGHTSDIATLSGSITSLSGTVTSQINSLSSTVTGYGSQITALSSSVTSLSSTVTGFTSQISDLSGSVTSLSGTITSLSASLTGISSGTGTIGSIAKFATTGSLGNSIIQDNGTVITIGGSLTANSITTTSISTESISTGSLISTSGMKLVTVLANDHTISGITFPLTAHEWVAFGDVCYINSSGKAQLINATAISTMNGVCMCADATISANTVGLFIMQGIARDDTWNWNVGGSSGLIYGATAGTSGNTLTQTAPTGTNHVIQILGVATHADRMLFNPQLVQVEHT